MWIASTSAFASDPEIERPTTEYDLPPVIKVHLDGREMRCYHAGDDWRRVTRVFLDYRALHAWAPLMERDLSAANRDIVQLTAQRNLISKQLDAARSGWNFYQDIYRQERTLRLQSEQTDRTMRHLLSGGLVLSVVVIAVEAVIIAAR